MWRTSVRPILRKIRSSSVLVLAYQIRVCHNAIWATAWENQQSDCAPSEDSDQPGHPPSLIRVFAVRSMGNYGPTLFSCGQRIFRSDWADAQADLSLRWAHSHFVGFVMLRLIYTIAATPVCMTCIRKSHQFRTETRLVSSSNQMTLASRSGQRPNGVVILKYLHTQT